jgi:hypothetical protein
LPARIRADREERTVREVHEPEQTEDDRQPEGDECQDRTEGNAVEQLRRNQVYGQALFLAAR